LTTLLAGSGRPAAGFVYSVNVGAGHELGFEHQQRGLPDDGGRARGNLPGTAPRLEDVLLEGAAARLADEEVVPQAAVQGEPEESVEDAVIQRALRLQQEAHVDGCVGHAERLREVPDGAVDAGHGLTRHTAARDVEARIAQ
jgi:hypothetical protein